MGKSNNILRNMLYQLLLPLDVIIPNSIFYSSLWERVMTWAKTIHVIPSGTILGGQNVTSYTGDQNTEYSLRVNESLMIIVVTRWEAASFKLS